MSVWAALFVLVVLIPVVSFLFIDQYKNTIRETKNYERGLKMVPMKIHLPPPSDDIEGGSRDERDVVDEALSQAQTMYNIIYSTATKGFKTKLYGQRHISFEIVASDGLIHYYAVVPAVITETVKQAIEAAYPAARLEEIEMKNIFSQQGGSHGVIGGEFTLKKDYIYPISTYEDSKRDASRALLDALSRASRGDGMAVQFMFRPASEDWTQKSIQKVDAMRKNKKTDGTVALDIMEALWKPPQERSKDKPEFKNLTSLEESEIEAIERKIRYPGYETLVRVAISSSTSSRSQALLQSVIAAFSMFDSPTYNGFKFNMTNNIDDLVTSYIFRFFPQNFKSNILNSVELSTMFHLPSRTSIPTEKVQRQRIKQVDGPTELMDEGLLLGVNEFRGVKKQIRLGENDRRRHVYIIGQTGMGKSKLLENLAYQDIMDGRGFAFIDPHGDSAEELIGMIPKERIDDVIYFNPSDIKNPIGFNMFEATTPEEMDFVISETNSMLKSLYDPENTGIVGPRMENIVRNAAILLMSDPDGGTFMDIPKVLVDAEFAKSKIKYLKNQRAIDFWTKEWPASQRSNDAGEVVSWVVSKWAPFESGLINNILGQKTSGFNIREVMDGQKILIVNLSKGLMGEQAAKLLGMVFVMKFQAAAMSRADTPESERKDFCLYVDEFQNFATNSFESILSEARKYRLNLILANQFMTQLTDTIKSAITGNVPTKIVGRIGIDDAENLQRAFTPTFTAEDLTKLPNYNAVATILVGGIPSAPFTMALLPPIGRSNQQLRDALKRYSSSKYGRPKAIVEAELKERLRVKTALSASPPASGVSSEQGGQPASTINEQISALNSRPLENTAPQSRSIQPQTPKSSGAGNQSIDRPSFIGQNPALGGSQGPANVQSPQNNVIKSPPQSVDDSFLDGWLRKREELREQEARATTATKTSTPEVINRQTKSASPARSEPFRAQTPLTPKSNDNSGRFDVNSRDNSEEVIFKIR